MGNGATPAEGVSASPAWDLFERGETVLSIPAGATTPTAIPSPGALQRAAKITAGVGIFHALLMVVTILLVYRVFPAIDAPDEDYVAFMNDDGRKQVALIAGVYLLPFAGIAYVWFTVALRQWLLGSIQGLNRMLADVLLVCGIAYVVLIFCNGASIATVAMHPSVSNVEGAVGTFRDFPLYGRSLFLIFAMRMAAMTVFTISNIGRKLGAFPTWFSYSGYAIGIFLLLTASLNPLLALFFPAWIAVFCLLVVRQARTDPIHDGEGGSVHPLDAATATGAR